MPVKSDDEAPGALSYSNCPYSTFAVTSQAAAGKKRFSPFIRVFTLSLRTSIAFTESLSSRDCNSPDRGPTFSLKNMISSTDFPRSNSVSNGSICMFV